MPPGVSDANAGRPFGTDGGESVKIYTRKGDTGWTGLRRGVRVAKTDPRVEACGALDEANAVLGVVAANTGLSELKDIVRGLQDMLFATAADVASAGSSANSTVLPSDAVERIEETIDAYDAQLPALTSFIVPGGNPTAAHLHHARVVCRRAERAVCEVAAVHRLPETTLACVNRMSDLLFVLARWANRQTGHDDVPWRATQA